METPDKQCEYQVISGWEKDWAAFNKELNAQADKGWEVFQSSACSCGGFLGSGLPGLVIVLRRPKS